MKVLLCEDNPILLENTLFLLKKMWIQWEWAKNGYEGLIKVSSYTYDVIVLDINMPVMNGREFLKQLRDAGNTLPVIALTSNSMLWDKLDIFDLWADDYMTKPFDVEELVMRIKVVSKRSDTLIDQEIVVWKIQVNLAQCKVFLDGSAVNLPQKQYLIIEYLAKNMWYAKSKTSIMQYVWWEQEDNLDISSTTLESHIYAIRSKLWKGLIQTQKWVWYIIQKDEEL